MEKQNINIDQQLIFPPWKLEGRGIILIYNLKKSCISPYLSTIDAHHLGGFSVLMLVDYQTSPIGPYHELLFIPGKFRIGKTSGYHISFIRVSTEISTINGIHHWAIPKKTGSFNVEYEQRLSTWNMNMQQESFYGKFEHSSLSVPVFSHVLPYQLIQQKNNNLFTIRPLASGFAAISKVKSLKLDIPELSFLSGVSPFFACNISQFKMMFPLAKIVNK